LAGTAESWLGPTSSSSSLNAPARGPASTDTGALADIGLADWVSDLPQEDDLVDLSRGTPVRWVEGRGWIEDPA
jgi:hypothetical protein